MTVLERSELEASPLADLHTIANQIGIDGYRRLRKAELIDAILRVEEPPVGRDPLADDREEGGEPRSADRVRGGEPRPQDRARGGDPRPRDRAQAGESRSDDREEGDEALADDRGDRSPSRTRRRRFARLRRTADGEAGEQPVADPGVTEVEPGAEEAEQGAAEADSGAAQAEPGTAQVEPGAAEAEPGTAEVEPGAAQAEPGAAEAEPGAGEGQTELRSEPESDTEASAGAEADDVGEMPPGGSPAPADAKAPLQAPPAAAEADLVEGTVELLSNGSAFLRVDPPGTSDKDVYVSAAQVRRCELVAGDRVAGPVRRPRRSERYPSLVRVQTINGIPASEIAAGPRYEELMATFPDERLRLDSDDANLRAIDWLTPIGLGSRAVIVGPSGAGKTETLRRLLWALADTERLELSLVLVGIRPEEAADWRAGAVEPAAVLSFATPPDAQAQAVEGAIETAKRVAARGGNALVAIDTLDGLAPAAARKAMAAARNLSAAGSLTVIATGRASLGGETTVIALDPTLTATGRLPALDLAHSGTMRPELLVGDDGAHAIREARVAAIAG